MILLTVDAINEAGLLAVTTIGWSAQTLSAVEWFERRALHSDRGGAFCRPMRGEDKSRRGVPNARSLQTMSPRPVWRVNDLASVIELQS